MIPLIDLSADKKNGRQIKSVVNRVIDSGNYILGKELESFELKFADYVGTSSAVGVASGTDALRIILRALGVGPGDKVLTVAFTSPFTSIAILEAGAIPVFGDIDEKTWTLDVNDAQKKIDKKVKAIMPVHIYGNPCNMKAILSFAKAHKIKIIEDACQAHGATIDGKKVGSFGDAGAFSFYPTKNLGGLGDGGIVVSNNRKLANLIRLLRHGGQTRRFWHKHKGFNSRLDEIQAAVLEMKLKYLDSFNRKRGLLVRRYKKDLKDLPITFQESHVGAISANHLFVIRTKNRDSLKKFLFENNIWSDLYYPYPVDVQPAFREYGGSALAVTNKLCREVLALPLFPKMTYRQQDKVIFFVKKFFKR